MSKSTFDANSYPPHVKITVYLKDNVNVVRVRIKVKGSSNDEELQTDLSFPFKGIVVFLTLSACAVGLH